MAFVLRDAEGLERGGVVGRRPQLSGLAELAYALGDDVKVGGRRRASRRRGRQEAVVHALCLEVVAAADAEGHGAEVRARMQSLRQQARRS